jgi:hypothetical protein
MLHESEDDEENLGVKRARGQSSASLGKAPARAQDREQGGRVKGAKEQKGLRQVRCSSSNRSRALYVDCNTSSPTTLAHVCRSWGSGRVITLSRYELIGLVTGPAVSRPRRMLRYNFFDRLWVCLGFVQLPWLVSPPWRGRRDISPSSVERFDALDALAVSMPPGPERAKAALAICDGASRDELVQYLKLKIEDKQYGLIIYDGALSSIPGEELEEVVTRLDRQKLWSLHGNDSKFFTCQGEGGGRARGGGGGGKGECPCIQTSASFALCGATCLLRQGAIWRRVSTRGGWCPRVS